VPRTPLGSPVPRAVAVVVRGHKLLVIRRHLDGRAYAVLPGGGIGPGESPAQAAVRELAEECSLEGTVVRHLFDRDDGGRSASYVLVDAPEGEPVLGGDEARAHSPEDSYLPLWATEGELSLLGLLPEGIGERVAAEVWPLHVDEVRGSDWTVLERLWQLYGHDLSEFRHSAPDVDGLFQSRRLPGYREDTGSTAYLARLGTVPCGFALVHGLTDARRVMGEFFVTRSSRGRGVAQSLATHVVRAHPGEWAIPFQEENPRAATFWRHLAGATMTEVSERTVPVPGKDHLPPDVWLSGVTRTD
jgi:predicted acetyltransferase/ADP-ribose pyrophosphatase YjhB (NUDIX family)